MRSRVKPIHLVDPATIVSLSPIGDLYEYRLLRELPAKIRAAVCESIAQEFSHRDPMKYDVSRSTSRLRRAIRRRVTDILNKQSESFAATVQEMNAPRVEIRYVTEFDHYQYIAKVYIGEQCVAAASCVEWQGVEDFRHRVLQEHGLA